MIGKIGRFFSVKYRGLLYLLVALFLFRPHEASLAAVTIWQSFNALILVWTVYRATKNTKLRTLITSLATPIVILTWMYFFLELHWMFILVACLAAALMSLCAGIFIHDIAIKTRVDFECFRGLVCSYFLLGFVFAYISLISEYFSPGTFLINNAITPVFPSARYLSYMLYYNFSILLLLGANDVVPGTAWGQTIMVINGMAGQFYIATLVARIVSAYSLFTDVRALPQKEASKIIHK